MELSSLIAILGIGIASNLDNAGVGVAYGVRRIRISTLSNSIIALMGFFLAFIGGVFGNLVSLWLPTFICSMIGMAVLVIIGIWVLVQPFLRQKEEPKQSSLLMQILRNPENADLDGSKSVGLGEAILLGIALSINNLAGGFDAGITHLNIWLTSFVSGLFSYLSVGLCAYVGTKYAADKLGKHASIVSGLLLILVGLHQVIN